MRQPSAGERRGRRGHQAALVVVLLLSQVLAAPAERSLYVAPNGQDNWTGALAKPAEDGRDGPLATLAGARDAIRRLKAAGPLTQPVTVWVAPGVYPQATALKLDAQDSGTTTAPIVYRGQGATKPLLIGGRTITGFKPYRGSILQANLAGQGFPAAGFGQLICNGRRQPLARYPNYDPANPYGGGWAYVDGQPVPMYTDRPDDDKRSVKLRAENVRTWARPDDGQVFIFARYNWWNNIVPIKAYDAATRTLALAGNCSYPVRPGDRYYVQGLFEELDAPGEWYLDRRTATLYFWPPQGVDPATMQVSAPITRTILELGDGVSRVTFRGFVFECSEGTAITLKNTTDCLVAGNVIRNVGDYGGNGITVTGGFRNGVVGNDLAYIGHDAISLTGGDRITLTPGDSYADNNYIHHPGVYYKWGKGVELHGCGLRAAHNLIHDCPRAAIGFMGNNLVMEYNHVRHLCLESEDAAGIGTGGRDWISSRGSVVRYNLVHDVLGYGQERGRWVTPFFAWGIYLDDNTGGVDVIGNTVYRCGRAGLHLHNARDTVVENNIFADSVKHQIELSGWTVTSGNWSRHLPTMIQGYNSVIAQPAWQAMRGMKTKPENAPLPSGMIMAGNVFERNILVSRDGQANLYNVSRVDFSANHWDHNLLWSGGQPPLIGGLGKVPAADQWGRWRDNKEDPASRVADPRFVDAAHDDFRLAANSPALELGFKPLPVDQIGLYQDEFRASWPVVEAEGAREHPLISQPAKPEPPAPPRLAKPVTAAKVGQLPAGAWPGAPLRLAESPMREPLPGEPCRAAVCHDGQRLYVQVTAPVADATKLRLGTSWGTDDAAEVCFQDVSGAGGPVYVLHGFASGRAECIADGGAPTAAVKRLGEAVRYVAQVSPRQWTGTFTIPLDAAGVAYRPGLKLAFNLGVRRTASDDWAIWVGALGATWNLDRAGYLVLE